jgi:hypothetical protein
VLLFSSALICDVYAVDEIINDSLLRKVIFIREDIIKTKPYSETYVIFLLNDERKAVNRDKDPDYMLIIL